VDATGWAWWTATALAAGILAVRLRDDARLRPTVITLLLAFAALLLALGVAGPAGTAGWTTRLAGGTEQALLRAVWTPDPRYGALVPTDVPLHATTWLHLVEAAAAWALAAGWCARLVDLPTASAVLVLVGASAWSVNATGAAEPVHGVMLATLLAMGLARAWATATTATRVTIAIALVALPAAFAPLGWQTALIPAVGLLSLATPPTTRAWRRRVLAVVATWALSSLALGSVAGGIGGLLRDLFTVGSPGLAGLTLLGMWAALGRGGAWTWLVLVTVTAGRAAASLRSPYDALEREAWLLGPLLLLAAQGARLLVRQAGGAGQAVLFGMFSMAVFPAAYRPAAVAGRLGARVETSHTEGLRFVLDVAAAHPGCALVTRVYDHGSFASATYGTPDSACQIFVAGLDCSLPGADCEVTDAPHLQAAFPAVPERDADHPHPEGLRFGAWALTRVPD
jgi:hypothetical protein